MSPSPRARQGIVLVILATACFGALDTLGKYLSHVVPLVMAMWARFLFQAAITACTLVPSHGRALFRTRHLGLQLLRGALLAACSSVAFLSLRFMPVGEFTAIIMLTPMLITVLSATTMGESVSPLRWWLLGGGLAGALMVIQPGADNFTWAMLLPLLLVLLSAAFQLLTSHLARLDNPGTLHFYSGAVGAVLTTVALPFYWELPSNAWVWALLLLLGVLGALGHYLLILGHSRTTPSVITPYLYFQVAFATLGGWLVFAHTPNSWALLGIALIAVCGVAGAGFRAGLKAG